MRLLCIIILSISQILAQNSKISPLNIPEQPDHENKECLIVELDSTSLFSIWSEEQLFGSHSVDKGVNWSEKISIVSDEVNDLQTVKLASGRILLTYYDSPSIYSTYSDDDGTSWEEPLKIATLLSLTNGSSLNIIDGEIYLISTRGKSSYYYKTIDGITWEARETLFTSSNTITGVVLSKSDSTIFTLYSLENELGIFKLYSQTNDQLSTEWVNKSLILQGDSLQIMNRLRGKRIEDEYYLMFEKDTFSYDSTYQKDLVFIKRSDSISWTDPEMFTTFSDDDSKHNLFVINDELMVTFQSKRLWNGVAATSAEYTNTWFGSIDSEDYYTPPQIIEINYLFKDNDIGVSLIPKVKAYDDDGISSVELEVNGSFVLDLFDDGEHYDLEAMDNIFSNIFNNLSTESVAHVGIKVIDSNLNSTNSLVKSFFQPEFENNFAQFIMQNNRSSLPIDYKGKIGGVNISSGLFDGITTIFSGGFGLSGLADNELWANGVISSYRIEDYVAGAIDSADNSDIEKIYLLNESDPEFGDSWQEWKNAVKLGARYYDGNNDGMYNPEDLNGNGKWDEDEDRPDLLGSITAWSVFNDGTPMNLRRFTNMEPLGIEIKQTIFSVDSLKDVFFIRYEIENKSETEDIFDSVYFSFIYDFDLGYFTDDLIYSSVEDQAIGVYNSGYDDWFGEISPSIAIALMQGPYAFIPGHSYSDKNNNNLFDSDIDDPILSASSNLGGLLGTDEYAGAINLNATSSLGLWCAISDFCNPDNSSELRYLHLGNSTKGNRADPCDTLFGSVFGEDCNMVDPNFMFSGDPVNNNGWINTHASDKQVMLNVGPFNLEKNRPQSIIGALITQRHFEPDNIVETMQFKSAELVKTRIKEAREFYDANFRYDIVSIDSKNNISNNYKLYQNYPNPFNPATVIKYTLPSGKASNVTLKIYDILGREVSTLVNKKQLPGEFEVIFDATQFPSGVYFYKLKADHHTSVKKMILLK